MIVNLFCNARFEGFQPYLDSVALYLETNMGALLFSTSATINDEIIRQNAYSLYLLASMCGALALE